MNQLPNFAPVIRRKRMGDLFQDDGLWTPDTSTITDTTDSGGFVGPVMPADDGSGSSPSWLTTAISTATQAAVNAAKNALGIRTPTTVRRPTTSAMPSWLLPVGIGVVALILLNKKK